MKLRILFFLCILSAAAYTQNRIELKGKVTYRSSQNIYVQFSSTEGISQGDTLYFKNNGGYTPAVLVKFISSKSAAGELITRIEPAVNSELIALVKENSGTDIPEGKDTLEYAADSVRTQPVELRELKTFTAAGKLSGRYSLQSYTTINNFRKDKSDQRWRHTFSLNSGPIAGSAFSISAYFSFHYKAEEWHKIKDDPGKSLRVYDLAARYDIDETFSMWVGRYLNRKITNISSVDGIQAEKYFGSFYAGVLAGSRPDFTNLGFNLKLFQFGGYLGRTDSINGRSTENSIAAVQQTNNFKTDRRFIYFQHSNNLIPNTTIFFTGEADLYRRISGRGENKVSLTGIYVSARYTPSNIISLSLSYDARKNVIYYETFKNFTDSLLENEARQGFRGRADFRPFKGFSAGLAAGYRFSKSDIKPSRNFSGFISQSNIPFINISASLSYNKLYSSYLSGDIAAVNFQKSLDNPAVNIGAGYRKTVYKFTLSEIKTEQDEFNLNVNTRIFHLLYINFSVEAILENQRTYLRYLLNFSTRF